MAHDYDMAKTTDESLDDALTKVRVANVAKEVESDDLQMAEDFELPGGDILDDSLSIEVTPKQKDEFTCMSCFLIRHVSQLSNDDKENPICNDCA
jgi:hypothetical protein